MIRSVWKGPIVRANTVRNITIIDSYLHIIVHIHNGRKYIPIYINNKMLSYKFGKFIPTKKLPKNNTLDKKLRN